METILLTGELVLMMQTADLKLQDIQGMVISPFSQSWSLADDLAVNYIASFSRDDDNPDAFRGESVK